MKVAVIGATGLVGSVMLKVLEESSIKINELIPAASEKSLGKVVTFLNKNHKDWIIKKLQNFDFCNSLSMRGNGFLC